MSSFFKNYILGKADESKLNIQEVTRSSKFADMSHYLLMLKMRIPYYLEERFGLNMSFVILRNTPSFLHSSSLREAIKNFDIDEIKQ